MSGERLERRGDREGAPVPQLTRVSAAAAHAAVEPDVVVRHNPDSHGSLIDNEGLIIGRCSLWWNGTPGYQGHRVGFFGHYAVRDANAARTVLANACRRLDSNGCTIAVGPIDGNTWRRYRCVTERGREPTFFMEPENPDDWSGHFVENGFHPIAHYTSTLHTDLGHVDQRVGRIAGRMTHQGIRIRSLDLEHFDDDLRRIFAVSRTSFRNNLLYSPIDEAEFIEQYRPIRLLLRPELVLIAEDDERPVGFVFAMPDLLQAKQGESIDTIIVKSVAVLPGREFSGLGHVLVWRAHAAAHALGYTRAIHALMHDQNASRNLCARTARPMRRYALFARVLGS